MLLADMICNVLHRLFIGLRPPKDVRALLLGMMGGVAAARWQSDDQLHLTLRFIGDVDGRMAEDVALTIARVHTARFTTSLHGVGQFSKLGRTNAIWAGLTPGDALTSLHRKIDQALIRIGLTAEGRAYVPHITLARLPRSAGAEHEVSQFLAAHGGLTSTPFAFSHVTLFESHLTRDGARYDAIDRWPIGV